MLTDTIFKRIRKFDFAYRVERRGDEKEVYSKVVKINKLEQGKSLPISRSRSSNLGSYPTRTNNDANSQETALDSAWALMTSIMY
jgi:hypothetical protein